MENLDRKENEIEDVEEELTILDAIYARRSVRQFTEETISGELRQELESAIHECNKSDGVRMHVFYEDPSLFTCRAAKRRKFENAVNYILVYGPSSEQLEELCGYYGEMIVLKLQQMGLRSCWVGETFNKRAAQQKIPKGQKVVAVIAFGFGQNDGWPHGGKFLDDVMVCEEREVIPAWFKVGAEAALLAPTARFNQNYKVFLTDEEAHLKMTRHNPFVKVDRGILRCHFEMASGHKLN